MKTYQWHRVSKKSKCPICDKPDWCSVCPELNIVHCLRMTSDRVSKNSMGGWIHKIGNQKIYYVPPLKEITPSIDFTSMWNSWKKETKDMQIINLSIELGINQYALKKMDCVWSKTHSAWAFPMRNQNMEITGFRLRNSHGRKWAIKGSRQNLFIPILSDYSTVYICEGPTDCAAALSIGLTAIARPSCLGCESAVSNFLKIKKTKKVVIISDNDKPGIEGANQLQRGLKVKSIIWITPTKDMRDYVKSGGTKELMQSNIKDMIWSY